MCCGVFCRLAATIFGGKRAVSGGYGAFLWYNEVSENREVLPLVFKGISGAFSLFLDVRSPLTSIRRPDGFI